MKKLRIRPRARIINSIGKDLIKDEIAAIIELIKNSYDADAEEVKIFIEKNEKNIIFNILDNGTGMSSEIIENSWLVPGTTNKIDNPFSLDKKRRVLGSKGLGRYSVGILGNKFLLKTLSNNIESKFEIDWNELSKHEYLDEVTLSLETTKIKGSSYTNIKIISEENIDTWNSDKFNELKKQLKLLVTPENLKGDKFDIIVKISDSVHDFFDEEIIEPFEIIDYYHYELKGEVDLNNNIFNLIFKNNTLVESFEYILDETHPLYNSINRIGFTEKLIFNFRVFDRESESLKVLINRGLKDVNGNFLKINETKRLLNEICGISVFRDNFRIRPYGDPGKDWLELDRERVNNPSFKLSNNQINGNIYIESESESNLEETSARDGLQENEIFIKFKKTILKLIGYIEGQRKTIKSNKKIGRETTNDKLNRLLENFGEKKELNKHLSNSSIPVEDKDKIVEIFDKQEEKAVEIVEELEREIAMYQQHVTLGKLVKVLMHEGRKNISVLRSYPEILLENINECLKFNDETLINSIEEDAELLKTHGYMLSILFDKINPLAKRRSKNRKDFKLKKALDKAIAIHKTELIKKSINVNANLDQEMIFGWEEDFITAFSNLIDNSIYWMEGSSKKEISILSDLSEENISIDYQDTGKGVQDKLIDTGEIFEPGVSYKEDGTGLGLAISGESLQRNGFSLQAFKNVGGAFFRIEYRGEENNGQN